VDTQGKVIVAVISRDGEFYAVYSEGGRDGELVKMTRDQKNNQEVGCLIMTQLAAPVIDLRPIFNECLDMHFPIVSEAYPREGIGPRLPVQRYLAWFENAGATVFYLN
jgi:hypothetical protein